MGPKLCHNYTNQSSSEPLAQVSFACLSVKMAMPTAELTAKVPVMLCPAFHGKCSQTIRCVKLQTCFRVLKEWERMICFFLEKSKFSEWFKCCEEMSVLYQAGRCWLRGLLLNPCFKIIFCLELCVIFLKYLLCGLIWWN